MRYALGSSCTRTADVTCNSTSPTLAYSAPFSLVDNRYPLFYDGSQYTACVKVPHNPNPTPTPCYYSPSWCTRGGTLAIT